jgi:decaprenylphospho-beta-D-ribofuranose 2-oxidase
VRGADPADLLKEIRKQSSFPLLALLARRLRTFDSARMVDRTQTGKEFANSLPRDVAYAGCLAEFQSYWVFPIFAEARERLAATLRERGFDSTSAGSALSVIDPPGGREDLEPAMIRDAYRKLLYLPVYPAIPGRQRMRMSKAIGEIIADRSHLGLRDARRVYAAVASTVEVPRSLADICNALRQAHREGRCVCLMGASHNLGGHAFVDDAVVLDMKQFAQIRALDVTAKRITVDSGVTWDKMQEVINPVGLAVKSMQSDNNFTVGGSLAANAHGRDVRFSMLIESVIGFRMMLADGSVVRVSRDENAELFGLAIGGYGLFGIILDVDLQLVENCVYEESSRVLPMSTLVPHLQSRVLTNSAAEFLIGRPSISPRAFLKDTIVTVWSRTTGSRNGVLALDHERNVARDRFLFGLSRKYKWGKTLRWYAEKHLAVRSDHQRLVSRNNAMRPPVSAIKMFEYNSGRDTDVIQEYFVPVARFTDFFDGMRTILAEEQTNLLGITIRYVKANSESVLSYAPREDALAAVLYFNEAVSPEGRAKTDVLLERLTSLALEHGGTFYLTYLRNIEGEMLRRAYPNIEAFFQKKHLYDPHNLFTSRFFAEHGKSFQQARAATAS